MLIFVRNEKGRPEAQEGGHDDLVMGLAITYYIREQQTFKLLPEEKTIVTKDDYSSFGAKDRTSMFEDYGSEIEII